MFCFVNLKNHYLLIFNKLKTMNKICDFIKENEMSLRLKMNLCKLKYTYMDELSVLILFKIRYFGVKQIRELLEIYPELKNESGIISIEVLKSYK